MTSPREAVVREMKTPPGGHRSTPESSAPGAVKMPEMARSRAWSPSLRRHGVRPTRRHGRKPNAVSSNEEVLLPVPVSARGAAARRKTGGDAEALVVSAIFFSQRHRIRWRWSGGSTIRTVKDDSLHETEHPARLGLKPSTNQLFKMTPRDHLLAPANGSTAQQSPKTSSVPGYGLNRIGGYRSSCTAHRASTRQPPARCGGVRRFPAWSAALQPAVLLDICMA